MQWVVRLAFDVLFGRPGHRPHAAPGTTEPELFNAPADEVPFPVQPVDGFDGQPVLSPGFAATTDIMN
jgi:hypothetical protein